MYADQLETLVLPATVDQLPQFVEQEKNADTAAYILPTTLEQHQDNFTCDEITYLQIVNQDTVIGYFILALDADPASIEFRRIVVFEKGRGIAQIAIPLMEEYCRLNIPRPRIWLDVYDFNSRGIHLYEKLGYRRFDQREHQGKRLFFYDKKLA